MADYDQLARTGARRSVRRASELYGREPAGAVQGEDRADDPVVYEVFEWPAGPLATSLLGAVTAIRPGGAGGVPFHTRGHFHQDPDGEEAVIALSGQGRLELLSRSGEHRQLPVQPLSWLQVPDGWAHRMTNLGSVPLVFLSICSAVVGHDYQGVPLGPWTGGEAPRQSETRRYR
ncbi:MAG: glucose-6-phosphate isomerase family protein [Acidimicrobiales bacterium]